MPGPSNPPACDGRGSQAASPFPWLRLRTQFKSRLCQPHVGRRLRATYWPLWVCTALKPPRLTHLGQLGAIKLQGRYWGSEGPWGLGPSSLVGFQPEELHCSLLAPQPLPESAAPGQPQGFHCSVDVPRVSLGSLLPNLVNTPSQSN